MTKLEWMAGLVAAALVSFATQAAAQDSPTGKNDKKTPAKVTPPAKTPAAPPTAAQVAAAKAAQEAVAQKAAALAAAQKTARDAQQQKVRELAAKQAAQLAKRKAAFAAQQAAKAGLPVPAEAAAALDAPAAAPETPAPPAAAQPADQAPAPAAEEPRWNEDDLTKSLSNYGQWLQDATYGQVWVPDAKNVGANFTPHVSGGHWNIDKGAWGWVSDYPWGGTAFHYGNWTWLTNAVAGSSPDGGSSRPGWAWVPGKTFAPAWVVWRLGEPGYDFVGWAPMPPAKAQNDVPPGSVAQPSLPFWFAPTRRIFSKNLDTNVVTDRALGQEVLSHSHIFDGNKVEGSSSFMPASPSLRDARIKALRRIILSTAGVSDNERQFATPPAAGSSATPMQAQDSQGQRPQYRCHLLSTHPRAWRCGYE